jgi:glycosyltransferase involved in cell wall biosynthesis
VTAWPSTLYVIQAAEPSGAETAMAPLLAADSDPLLACPAGSATAAYVHSLGVPTIDLPFRVLRHSGGRRQLVRSLLAGLASARELRRILGQWPDRVLIYANSLRPGMLIMLAGVGLRRRLVWAMTDFLPPPPLRQAIRLLTLLSGARVIAHSSALEQSFAGRSPRLRRRVTVVNPGVDTARFADPDGARRAERQPRAGVFGHVSPTKQTALALEITKLVTSERPDFGLDIVGTAQFRDEDFAYERELQARVASDPALRERVRLHGRVSDVGAVFEEVSMLLHCRPDEPFGMVLIEAMAAGLPVVAPGAAGPAEIIRHGETGFLYPPGDAAAAAAHVLALLDDPGLARAIGEAGRKAARTRFAAGQQLEALRAVLAGVYPA